MSEKKKKHQKLKTYIQESLHCAEDSHLFPCGLKAHNKAIKNIPERTCFVEKSRKFSYLEMSKIKRTPSLQVSVYQHKLPTVYFVDYRSFKSILHINREKTL